MSALSTEQNIHHQNKSKLKSLVIYLILTFWMLKFKKSNDSLVDS